MIGLMVVKIKTLVTYENDSIIKNEEVYDPDNYKDHTINFEELVITPFLILASAQRLPGGVFNFYRYEDVKKYIKVKIELAVNGFYDNGVQYEKILKN